MTTAVVEEQATGHRPEATGRATTKEEQATGHRPQATAKADSSHAAARNDKPQDGKGTSVGAAAPERSEMVLLNIDLIFPSLTNPRKIRHAEKDAEMLASVKTHGVLQPILCRPMVLRQGHLDKLKAGFGVGLSSLKPGAECYELVAGERRWEAAVRAGLAAIPVVVRHLTNEQAMEIQVIENDDRDDVDAIDRALGYRNLLEEHKRANKGTQPGATAVHGKDGAPAQEYLNYLAGRLNKKPRTIYQLMKLADASAEVQAALRSGKITESHVAELCRRTPDTQKELVKWILRFQVPASVRELKDHIKRECDLLLDAAPFKKDDVTLLAGAGACITCPKNSAVDPNLVEGAKGATCTDRTCYFQKLHNHIVRIETATKNAKGNVVRISDEWDARPTQNNQFVPQDGWKKASKGSCPHVATGIFIDGDRPGQLELVCTNKKCKVHWHQWESYYSGRAVKHEPGELRAKVRKNKLDLATRTAQSAALVKSVKKVEHADLVEVACMAYDRMDQRLYPALHQVMGWKEDTDGQRLIRALTPAQLAPLLVLMCVAPQVLPGVPSWVQAYDDADLSAIDKRHKLGLQKAKDKVTAELQAKFKEIDARRKAKEKKGKKPAQTSARKAAAGS